MKNVILRFKTIEFDENDPGPSSEVCVQFRISVPHEKMDIYKFSVNRTSFSQLGFCVLRTTHPHQVVPHHIRIARSVTSIKIELSSI